MIQKNSIIGWVILDKSGKNFMLYNPTSFFFEGEEDGNEDVLDVEVVVPLMFDKDRYTVFRTEEAANKVAENWKGFFEEIECTIIPLVGWIDTNFMITDFTVDNNS